MNVRKSSKHIQVPCSTEDEDIMRRIKRLNDDRFGTLSEMVFRLADKNPDWHWDDVDWKTILNAIEADVLVDDEFSPMELKRMRFEMWLTLLSTAEKDRVHTWLKRQSKKQFAFDEMLQATKIKKPLPNMSNEELFHTWFDRHFRHEEPSALMNDWGKP